MRILVGGGCDYASPARIVGELSIQKNDRVVIVFIVATLPTQDDRRMWIMSAGPLQNVVQRPVFPIPCFEDCKSARCKPPPSFSHKIVARYFSEIRDIMGRKTKDRRKARSPTIALLSGGRNASLRYHAFHALIMLASVVPPKMKATSQ